MTSHTFPHAGDTETLLRLAAAGDSSAAGELLQRSRRPLKKLFRLWMHPRLAARVDPSDAVQETLLLTAKRLPVYLRDRPLPFHLWLRQLGWEQLLQLHRRHLFAKKRSVRREHSPGPLLPDESARILSKRLVHSESSPHGKMVRDELTQQVRRALRRLGERDREILVLKHLEERSTKEISILLAISEAAVKVRHFRAVRRIRDLLENDDNSDSGSPPTP